jgi:hypothetical protein
MWRLALSWTERELNYLADDDPERSAPVELVEIQNDFFHNAKPMGSRGKTPSEMVRAFCERHGICVTCRVHWTIRVQHAASGPLRVSIFSQWKLRA